MDYARHRSTQGTSDHNDLLAQHSTTHRSCGTQHIGTILDCARHISTREMRKSILIKCLVNIIFQTYNRMGW